MLFIFSKTFSYLFLPFLNRSTQSNFCHFPGQNLQGFSSCIFMDFFLNILNKEKLGVLLFLLFLIKFDQGVFVPRCCYHDSHALRWLILCFEKNWKSRAQNFSKLGFLFSWTQLVKIDLWFWLISTLLHVF